MPAEGRRKGCSERNTTITWPICECIVIHTWPSCLNTRKTHVSYLALHFLWNYHLQNHATTTSTIAKDTSYLHEINRNWLRLHSHMRLSWRATTIGKKHPVFPSIFPLVCCFYLAVLRRHYILPVHSPCSILFPYTFCKNLLHRVYSEVTHSALLVHTKHTD